MKQIKQEIREEIKNKITFKCNKCNELQPKNEKDSNENWEVYDADKKCKCGGKFVIYLNNEKI